MARKLSPILAQYTQSSLAALLHWLCRRLFVKKRLLEELGPTELVWIWEVKDFGPLLVTQDHQGGDIKKVVTMQATEKLDALVKTYA